MVENNVKERRNELGITQVELAKRTGISQSTISEIESGSHQTSLENALLIADVLNTTVDRLFWIR